MNVVDFTMNDVNADFVSFTIIVVNENTTTMVKLTDNCGKSDMVKMTAVVIGLRPPYSLLKIAGALWLAQPPEMVISTATFFCV